MANLLSQPPISGVGGGKASNGFIPLETLWIPLIFLSVPPNKLFPTFVFWGPSVQSLAVFLVVPLSLKIKKKKNMRVPEWGMGRLGKGH